MENLISIYNEALSAGSQGSRKHREMDLFMFGFVKDFPQRLKSIQEANYASDCERERDLLSFYLVLSALYIFRMRIYKREQQISRGMDDGEDALKAFHPLPPVPLRGASYGGRSALLRPETLQIQKLCKYKHFSEKTSR